MLFEHFVRLLRRADALRLHRGFGQQAVLPSRIAQPEWRHARLAAPSSGEAVAQFMRLGRRNPATKSQLGNFNHKLKHSA
jgi:hypothetical protein